MQLDSARQRWPSNARSVTLAAVAPVFADVPSDDASWHFVNWRDGQTRARIIWMDGLGAENESVIFNEREALGLLGQIQVDNSMRLLSCKVV